MKTDKCPCDNCVVFIMCKNRLRKECNSQVIQLAKTCAHLNSFIMQHSDTTKIARKTFGLLEWNSRLNYE